MPRPSRTSLRSSFRCAFCGIGTTFVEQRNLKIQSGIALLVLAAGLLFRLRGSEWATVILCMALVFTAELGNTALEHAVDLASPGYHETARRAKDAAAGATLVASIGAAIVGLIVFLPHILTLRP